MKSPEEIARELGDSRCSGGHGGMYWAKDCNSCRTAAIRAAVLDALDEVRRKIGMRSLHPLDVDECIESVRCKVQGK